MKQRKIVLSSSLIELLTLKLERIYLELRLNDADNEECKLL